MATCAACREERVRTIGLGRQRTTDILVIESRGTDSPLFALAATRTYNCPIVSEQVKAPSATRQCNENW